jgi:putative peptide zinc metalloprotease protein
MGTPLLALANRELELELEATEAQQAETLALQRRALHVETADLEPIRKRLEAIEGKLRDLQKQRAALIVKARQTGTWVAPHINEMVGAWIHRGTPVGEIVHHGAFRFSAVVSQEEAANLFVEQVQKAEVRLYGQGGANLEVGTLKIIPFQHEQLPSPALGWLGGGEVAVSVSDETGLKAAEPFFQIYAYLKSDQDVDYLHGKSGKIRFTMRAEPLLVQWIRDLRQLLQKRYRI